MLQVNLGEFEGPAGWYNAYDRGDTFTVTGEGGNQVVDLQFENGLVPKVYVRLF